MMLANSTTMQLTWGSQKDSVCLVVEFLRENKFGEGQREESLNKARELGLSEKSFLWKWWIL